MPDLDRYVIPEQQNRYIDPYQARIFQYDTPSSDVFISRLVNSLYKIFGDNIVINSFDKFTTHISYTNTNITFTFNPGMILQDSTLLHFPTENSVMLENVNAMSEEGKILIYCRYQYLESVEKNPAYLCTNYLATNGYPLYNWDHNKDKTLFGVYSFTKDENDNITSVTRDDIASIDIAGKTYHILGLDFPTIHIRQYLGYILGAIHQSSSIVWDDGLRFLNDSGDPGPTKYYGTDNQSNKGWHELNASNIFTDEGLVTEHNGNQYEVKVINGNLVLSSLEE